MGTVKFWRGTAERAAKTFAQSLITLITAVEGFNMFAASWGEMIGLALGTTLLSVLSSIASAGVGEPDSPSAIKEPQ